MTVAGGDVTLLLRRWGDGDEAACEALLPIIYDELHRIAERRMRGERREHTLRPTDLVSEAWLRLAQSDQPDWSDRRMFFAVAAGTMRRVLVDHARRRRRDKRGGNVQAVPFDDDVPGEPRSFDLVALDAALSALAEHDPRKARAIELNYFGGLSQKEIADVLDVHTNTIARDLQFAKAWIRRHLQSNP